MVEFIFVMEGSLFGSPDGCSVPPVQDCPVFRPSIVSEGENFVVVRGIESCRFYLSSVRKHRYLVVSAGEDFGRLIRGCDDLLFVIWKCCTSSSVDLLEVRKAFDSF
jgi:hypothetical protein